MSGRPPDFDELVGGGLAPDERERLRRVHELLVEAGPPPELPPALARPPAEKRPHLGIIPRRRRFALALVAAALLAATFGGGYLVGARSTQETVDFVVPMQGTARAPGARASIAVLAKDEAGNWPMRMVVRGLPAGRYELWLTRDGVPKASCGSFAVAGPQTEVHLNAPYKLKRFDGWIVTREGGGEALLRTEEI